MSMHVRFLLGPAGSGKTYRCLAEARRALAESPAGPLLLLIAPKQTTYQLERQLLAGPSVAGYTRLHILSFERLAAFIFDRLGLPSPKLLDEEGRLMVLRGLLARKRHQLKLFRASARLTGFAQQLSLVLRELQRHQLTPESLAQVAQHVHEVEGLAFKLQDLASLLRDYLDWLKAHNLQDSDCLLANAAEALGPEHNAERGHPCLPGPLPIDQLWVDGFAEWSPQELDLLAGLMPSCRQATLTFCLDQVPAAKVSWLSGWSVVRKSFAACRRRFSRLPDADICLEILPRRPHESRFLHNPVLQHLEKAWADPHPYAAPAPAPHAEPQTAHRRTIPAEGKANPTPAAAHAPPAPSDDALGRSLRVALCPSPEPEVSLAAREIRRHVRAGGRYREVTVLVRKLEPYHEPLQRLFVRYEIPFFLDRRESVSHHPLAELTRSALRTVAFGWQPDDWFAALKTGLLPAQDADIDRLENEALARGWQGSVWQKPITVSTDPALTLWLAGLQQKLLPPFRRLALTLAAHANRPTGRQLAAALRALWAAFQVHDRLRQWAAAEISASDFRIPNSVHATVWEQMNGWLQNVELAFADAPLGLRDWLPILDAGLAGLTVGVIPPALDQVLIGALDRSRNPDIKLALVLGLNETLFPAPPQTSALLSDADRLELEKHGLLVGDTARQQLARERHFAYIACTRARARLVLTSALHDAHGAPLNPSPFLSHLRLLFPTLPFEVVPPELDWRESEHPNELVVPLLRNRRCDTAGGAPEPPAPGSPSLNSSPATLASLASFPALASVMDCLRHFHDARSEERLAPELAAHLYGPTLRSSVSRLEQFAACPFKFFVHSGLRAEERQRFELDVREQGSFQHDVLALFHEQLRHEHKRWRDISPADARDRVARIALGLMASYRDGLLQATEQSRFLARIMAESLQDFVETLVGWMRQQYHFDPVAVELPFGEDESSPAWAIPLDLGQRLEIFGRIDRVDLCPLPGPATPLPQPPQPAPGVLQTEPPRSALCVVLDYKSGHKQLDPVLLAHGLQLQLLTYLNVLRHWPNPRDFFGVDRLVPAGVFYVSLRGRFGRSENRTAALADAEQARRLAYRHTGRFDVRALHYLDARPDAREGDQFNYRLTSRGEVYKNSHEALPTAEFNGLLDALERNLERMGRQIFSGQATVAPYRKGALTACSQCDYRSICRIDPWTHRFRVLRPLDKPAEAADKL